MNLFPKAMVTPGQFDRRSVLKGVTLGAGAVVLQPFLNGLAAEAEGQAPPKRIVFVVEANGLWPYHIQPRGVEVGRGDRLVDVSLRDLELPEPIAPLAPFKNRMTIIQNLSCRHVEPNHGGGYGALGCYNAGRNPNSGANVPMAQTIDHALAGAHASIVPVVGLGVFSRTDVIFYNSVSASARNRPLPMICQPDVAFQTLFGSVAEGSSARAFNARNRLLDWARADIRRVQSELPAMDREKLDVYLETFEQMRTRQDRVNAIGDQLRANRPQVDRFNSQLQTDRFEAQCAIAAAALASRLTNVVVLDASCGPHNYKTWRELGITVDEHGIGHTHPDDPARDRNAIPIRQFHAARVADLARRFEAIREGNGTMLDNTLIVYMSDAAEEHHGTGMRWPLVLVGNLGGKLRTDGRFLQYPRYNTVGHRTLNSFYLALLHAVGDRRERFGDPDSGLRDINTAGPLTEILV
jgi:hypothetical protein